MATTNLAQLTAIVRTFDRPKAISRLLKSIRRRFPELKILVADDGVESSACRGVEYLRLPSEKGLAAAQNAMLARVRTPYFLVLDDRMELPREPQIEPLLNLVTTDRLDIAAGSLIHCRRKLWFFVSRKPLKAHGLLETAGDRLTLLSGARSQGDGFLWCDFVPQYYVGRTDRVRSMGGWDPELRDECHEEFFYRAHCRGIRVGVLPDATVWHWETPHQHLAELHHQHSLMGLAAAKMGLSELTLLDGRVVRPPRVSRAA